MAGSSYVAVIDCGSQTTKLIARRIRELGVFTRIVMPSIKAHELMAHPPEAIILSGGPESLLDENPLRIDEKIFDLGIPILGICYGMQLMVEHFGGVLEKCRHREFGQRSLSVNQHCPLFADMKTPIDVWMSHSDQTKHCPALFQTIASSPTCHHAAIAHQSKKIFGVQFHPEVSHTPEGMKLLSNFLFTISNVKKSFDLADFLTQQIEKIKTEVGSARVIMGLSGGVDSMVAALIIHKAIKDQLLCVYVNHGLHRHHELEDVRELFFKVFGRELLVINAQEEFFSALSGVKDPEEKRRIIGRVFVEVFEKEAKGFEAQYLGQGTLYPDVIESPDKSGGPSHGIKSHHNVGGLPERMNMRLLEPLRELFKDEVRKIGKILGLSEEVVMREPFPGPGLSVRVPGEVTRERVELVRQADWIVREEMKNNAHLYDKKIWQSFAILLPVKSVGVMGDARAYGETIVIRSVESEDAMTADWSKLPYEVLGRISTRITNEVAGINRVLYDITQKPPGTIEWE